MSIKSDFLSAFEEILEEYGEEINQDLGESTLECAELYKKRLEEHTSKKGWKRYSKGFTIQTYESTSKYTGKYRVKHYVGNSLQTQDEAKIPLSNLLTYGATRKNRGIMPPDSHFETVYDKCENEMINIIEKKLGG